MKRIAFLLGVCMLYYSTLAQGTLDSLLRLDEAIPRFIESYDSTKGPKILLVQYGPHNITCEKVNVSIKVYYSETFSKKKERELMNNRYYKMSAERVDLLKAFIDSVPQQSFMVDTCYEPLRETGIGYILKYGRHTRIFWYSSCEGNYNAISQEGTLPRRFFDLYMWF